MSGQPPSLATAATSSPTKATVEEIKGGSMDDFERAITGLLNLGRQEVIMTTDLFPQFYSRPHVRDTMLETSKRTGDFRVVLDSHVDVKALRDVQELQWFFQSSSIEVAQSITPIPHWIMVDRNHFRFEKPHPPNTPGKDNLIIKFANSDERLAPYVAEAVTAIEEMWNSADPIEKVVGGPE